jgi:hypothetical protein
MLQLHNCSRLQLNSKAALLQQLASAARSGQMAACRLLLHLLAGSYS